MSRQIRVWAVPLFAVGLKVFENLHIRALPTLIIICEGNFNIHVHIPVLKGVCIIC